MRLTGDQILAVRRVLDNLGPEEKLSSVKLDGQEVSIDEVMTAEVDAAPKAAEPSKMGELRDKALGKLELQIEKVETKLDGSKFGRKVKLVLSNDPELVTRKNTLELTFDNGDSLTLPLDVVDRAATLKLEKISRVAELIAIVPLLGKLVPALTAIGSGTAALVAKARGDTALAEAASKTAGKHLVLLGVNFIPGVGEAACAMAAVMDNHQITHLRSPDVGHLNNLGVAPAAA